MEINYYAKKKEGATSTSTSNYYATSQTTNNYNSDHASEADKLTNPHTIWGQSFDGTQDINGDLISTGTVTAPKINTNYIKTDGTQIEISNNTEITGQLQVNSDVTFDENLTVDKDITCMNITVDNNVDIGSNLYVDNIGSNQTDYVVVESDLKATGELYTTNITPIIKDTYNLGSSSGYWLNGYIKNLFSDNINNTNKITTKDLTVTGSAHFFELIIDKIKAAGGAVLFTPADGFNVDIVENVTNGYKLYWRAQDADKNQRDNMWQVGDQAICKSFNKAKTGTSYNVSNKYYWSLVTSVSDNANPVTKDGVKYHYIVISTTTKDGTVNPEAGDVIAMLGHRLQSNDYDAQGHILSSALQRQSAIYIAAYESIDTGITAPLIAQYQGINDFNLSSHRKSYFDAYGAKFVGNFQVGDVAADTYINNTVNTAVNNADQHSPYIGANNHWYVWDKDTKSYKDSGVQAKGNNAVAPTVTIGANGNWFIDGVDTGRTSEGDDGHSPYINEASGTWWEWDAEEGLYVDTEIHAKGNDAHSPQVSSTGTWLFWNDTLNKYIDSGETVTGDDGHSPYIGQDGFWWQWDSTQNKYTATTVKAAGDEGKSPYIQDGFWYYWDGSFWVKGVQAQGESVSIKSTETAYQISTSGTVQPTGTWSTTVPTVKQGDYLWTRTTVTYNNDKQVITYAVQYINKDGEAIVYNGKDAEFYDLVPIQETATILSNQNVSVSLYYQINYIKGNTVTTGVQLPTGWKLVLHAIDQGQADYIKTGVTFSYNSTDKYYYYTNPSLLTEWYDRFLDDEDDVDLMFYVTLEDANGNRFDTSNIEIKADASVVFKVDTDNKSIHSQITGYESQLAGYDNDVKAYKNQVSAFEQTASGFSTQVGEVNTKYNTLSGKVTTAETNISSLKQRADSIESKVSSGKYRFNPYNKIPNINYAKSWVCYDSTLSKAHSVKTDGLGLFWCNENLGSTDLYTPEITFEKDKTYIITMGGYDFDIEIGTIETTVAGTYVKQSVFSDNGKNSYSFTPTSTQTLRVEFYSIDSDVPKASNGVDCVYHPLVIESTVKDTYFSIRTEDYSAITQSANEIKLSVNNAGILLNSEEIVAKSGKFTVQNNNGATTFKVDSNGLLVGGTAGGFVANDKTVRVGNTETASKSFAEITSETGNGVIRIVYNQSGTPKEGVKLSATQNGGSLVVKDINGKQTSLSPGTLTLDQDLYISFDGINYEFKIGGTTITCDSAGLTSLNIGSHFPTTGTNRGDVYVSGGYLMVHP